MPDKTVAVFGATGFIGSAVVDELLARGHQVRALARGGASLPDRAGVTFVTGDAGNPELVREVIKGSNAVVGCLGTRRGDWQPATFLADAMALILAAMRADGVGRLVAISGAGIRVAGESKPFPHNLITRVVASWPRRPWRRSSPSSRCSTGRGTSNGPRFGRPGWSPAPLPAGPRFQLMLDRSGCR